MTKSLSTRIAAFATSLLTTALLASNAEPLTGSGDSLTGSGHPMSLN